MKLFRKLFKRNPWKNWDECEKFEKQDELECEKIYLMGGFRIPAGYSLYGYMQLKNMTFEERIQRLEKNKELEEKGLI